MFFVIGIAPGRKVLSYELMVCCPQCGKWERCQIQMTYTCLALFFLPIFKWRKRYLLKMNCCQSVFELDAEIGKRIARNEEPVIESTHLRLLQAGRAYHEKQREISLKVYGENTRICPDCGEPLSESFGFCPKCGKPLKWA